MNESRFTEEQIMAVLKEAGAKIQDICRKYGISYATFSQWRSKHEGRELSGTRRSKQFEEENRRLRQLEEENQRLRSLVADLTLSNQTLKQVVSKKW